MVVKYFIRHAKLKSCRLIPIPQAVDFFKQGHYLRHPAEFLQAVARFPPPVGVTVSRTRDILGLSFQP
jgi:hypothetical protein